MTEKDRPITVLRVLELVSLVLCILTSLISASLIVFKGGALVQLIDGHEKRISQIEAQGSPRFTEHFKLDDAREERTRADIKRMEELITRYADLGAKLDGMSYKVDAIDRMLKSHMESVNNRE